MFQALYLSLFRYRLTAPDDKEFVGLGNYVTVLTDSLFWKDTSNTVVIMVVTVAVELVIGFAFAMVMHRIIFARGADADLDPDPLRHHHRGLGVRLAVRLQHQQRLRQRWFAWLPWISPDTNWFGDHWPAMFAIMVSEIWKTTPFMSLLLLAGLSQVSEDMLEAAQVDGATWWQRLYKVILPNMRAAIMVAVLFRALDAFRIFDNIYIMTKGAQDTESSSFLTYRQVIEQLQLGLGSALSVLLFLSVLLLAFLIVKLFRVDLAAARGRADERRSSQPVVHLDRLHPHPGLVPAAGGVDHLAVVQVGRPRPPAGSPQFLPKDVDDRELQATSSSQPARLPAALLNSFGIAIIATVLSVIFATLAAYAIARLEFRGKRLVLSLALAIAMFPVVALVGPLFDLWRTFGLFNTWPGLIIPYMSFTLPLAIWTLSAFFREIPWEMEQAAQVDGATSWQAFRKVIVPLAAPGVFTAAILTFFFAWNEFVLAISLTSTTASRTVPAQMSFFVGPDPFNPPYCQLAAASVIVTVPIIIIVLLFQRKIVAGLTSGAVKG